ncbi:hypothetical protein, partial [Klebsiella pneumoniae]|uniref:hypothetical protein n=1 Tax=Klebsiella pneumoniae TaxID=573 RepID=UPI0011E72FAB
MLRLVEILRESWIDFANRPESRAPSGFDPVQKRDLRGSDKIYPPILPGDPAKVWIVERGPDALALHDIAKRSGQ